MHYDRLFLLATTEIKKFIISKIKEEKRVNSNKTPLDKLLNAEILFVRPFGLLLPRNASKA